MIEEKIEVSEPQDYFILLSTIHSPISIESNADFITQGFPGSGTLADPYLVKGFEITTTGVCISIQDTNTYFVIRDCILTGGTGGKGVDLINVTNGEIRNNTIFENNDGGIWLSSSFGNVLVNNTISENGFHNVCDGVSLYASSNNTIVNNTISGNNYFGVNIYSSSNSNKLDSNVILGNGDEGVRIDSSSNNIVVSNIILGNNYGVTLDSSSSNSIVNNNISGNTGHGVQISSSTNNTLGNNIILRNSAGVLSHSSSNNTIVNNTISGSNYSGVSFLYSSNTSVVTNIISGNGNDGVSLSSSSNNTILNNTISENTGCGVFLGISSGNTVVSNCILENHYGVHCWTSSNNNLIYLNIIAYNYHGIDRENAYDSGTDNHWNTTGMGNYWSDHFDYLGTGEYSIPGYAHSIDYHPFIYSSDTTTSTTTPNDGVPTQIPETSSMQILYLGGALGIIALAIVIVSVSKKRSI